VGSPLVGRVSHPLDDKRCFIESSHTPLLTDQHFLVAPKYLSAVTILGPAPQAMERKDGRYRAQLLLQCARRAPLHGAVSLALGEIRKSAEARKVRWSLDVDPLEL
jgi:primosomal protein N'